MQFFSTGSFTLTKNTNDSINVSATDDNGNPINISGYTFYFTAKDNPALPDCDAAIYKVQTTHSNAVNGQTSFPIYPSDTSCLLPGKYFYDIVSYDSGGNFTSWENDAFYLKQSIHNRTTGSLPSGSCPSQDVLMFDPRYGWGIGSI